MSKIRTTVLVEDIVFTRVKDRITASKQLGEKGDFSSFLQRALVNQLEREGDFEIRDLIK